MTETILIVDDTATNIQLVAALLDPMGYELSFANSGADALEQGPHTNPGCYATQVAAPHIFTTNIAQFRKCNRCISRFCNISNNFHFIKCFCF